MVNVGFQEKSSYIYILKPSKIKLESIWYFYWYNKSKALTQQVRGRIRCVYTTENDTCDFISLLFVLGPNFHLTFVCSLAQIVMLYPYLQPPDFLQNWIGPIWCANLLIRTHRSPNCIDWIKQASAVNKITVENFIIFSFYNYIKHIIIFHTQESSRLAGLILPGVVSSCSQTRLARVEC